MLDIMLKLIIQDAGSKGELSTRKYKLMMVLEDEVSADWASFIFSCLLNNVKMCHAMKKKSPEEYNDVYFGLMISFLLEKNMPIVDRGEELVDSDFLP